MVELLEIETLDQVLVHFGDLPSFVAKQARSIGLVAWDIETSGLDWRRVRIGICQILIPDHQVHIVHINEGSCPVLSSLLGDQRVRKVFHHAMFDLRFMAFQWSAEVANVACTKVASKILNPSNASHSLKDLLLQYLGKSIDKQLRQSNWMDKTLTDDQISYAAKDVLYLPALLNALHDKLVKNGRWGIAQACFNFLPTQVQLELMGFENIFQY